MKEHCSSATDVRFLYKIVSNNIIMKLMVSIKPDFNIEKDDVKFGFNLHMHSKRSSANLELKVPIQVNTGPLKLNKSGGNVSSAQSTASLRKGDQEAKLMQGKA